MARSSVLSEAYFVYFLAQASPLIPALRRRHPLAATLAATLLVNLESLQMLMNLESLQSVTSYSADQTWSGPAKRWTDKRVLLI